MNICVGNLAREVTDTELRKVFEPSGRVVSATGIRAKCSGESRGFGVVDMPASAEAQSAITGLQGMPRKRAKRRVNITIPAHCYEQVAARELNLSGLITNLLDDHFANSTITLHVSDDTKYLYQQVVSNTGYEELDIEVHLRVILQELLRRKIAELEHLRAQLAATTRAAPGDSASMMAT
jgi:RNA recognition motif-containing protein